MSTQVPQRVQVSSSMMGGMFSSLFRGGSPLGDRFMINPLDDLNLVIQARIGQRIVRPDEEPTGLFSLFGGEEHQLTDVNHVQDFKGSAQFVLIAGYHGIQSLFFDPL